MIQRPPKWLVGLGLTLSLMLTWSQPSHSQAAERYDELAERHRLQDTFPGGTPEEPKPPPASSRPTRQIPTTDISSGMLWVLGGGILVAFGFFIIRNVIAYRRLGSQYRRDTEPAEEIEIWGTVPDDSWDALLQRLRLSGDLNIALHEMLLAAIGYCQQELSIHIPRAQTPREISDNLPDDFAAAEDFETLVQGAELAWFGAKPVDQSQFQSGLAALERIIRL